MSDIQLMRSKDIHPSDENIAECLGSANKAYKLFTHQLLNYEIDIQWRYYTDGNAWLAKGLYRWTGVRGGKKELTVFWLSIWEGFFKVTVYVPEKYRNEALKMPLDDELLKQINDTSQMGKLKYFPIVFDLRTDDLLESVFTVIDFKKSIR